MALIHERMSAIMAEVEAIAKDKSNQQQGFKYRGIDDVMNNLHDLMAKHKVFVMPEFLEGFREERQARSGNLLIYSVCDYGFTFYTEDGSSVAARVRGEGMDSGDKASNKALSVALKYALLQAFMIPTVDMIDPDAETHTVVPKETIDDKLTKLPDTVKAFLKETYTKKSGMVTWCNHYAWDVEAMKKAAEAKEIVNE